MTERRGRRFCSARCRWRAANVRHRIPSGGYPWLGKFFAAVVARLQAGARQYGDRTFDLPVSTIVAEAQAELLDNAAYSFIAWCRLERLRQELDRVGPPSGQELP